MSGHAPSSFPLPEGVRRRQGNAHGRSAKNGSVCSIPTMPELLQAAGTADPRGKLCFHPLEVVRQHRPRMVIIENVEAFATLHKKAFAKLVKGA